VYLVLVLELGHRAERDEYVVLFRHMKPPPFKHRETWRDEYEVHFQHNYQLP
jgi:hypothetical protein